MEDKFELLEVLVPVAPSEEIDIKTNNTRIETLAGKRLGLFWNKKPNGDVLLTRFGELLKSRYLDIKVEWLHGKNDSAQGAPKEAVDEASQKCDAVINALGD